MAILYTLSIINPNFEDVDDFPPQIVDWWLEKIEHFALPVPLSKNHLRTKYEIFYTRDSRDVTALYFTDKTDFDNWRKSAELSVELKTVFDEWVSSYGIQVVEKFHELPELDIPKLFT